MLKSLHRAHLGATLTAFLGMGLPSAAQDLGVGALALLGQGVVSQGVEILDDAQEKLNELLMSAERGEPFENEKACLTALQAAVNTGALLSNGFPFSSVHTFEDARGPVARFRLLIYGDKLHLDTYCDGSTLSGDVLPWGEGSSAPVLFSASSFDAAAGLFLALHAHGAFDTRDEVSLKEPPATSEETDKPSMTPIEQDALRVGVQQCWNVGSLSSQALKTTVKVSVEFAPDGRPVPESLRMTGFEGGDERAAREAYESARRAIIRCGANGFDLPREKYDLWKRIEMTFNPDNMRVK